MTEKPLVHPHWMLEEIYGQPTALADTFDRYVSGGTFRDDTCGPIQHYLRDSAELVIAASGSSRHAGLVAERLIEDRSGLAVDVEYASEYMFRSELSLKNVSLIAISQSGETADTLAALRRAKAGGHATLAITNAPGSSMDREAGAVMPVVAGRERAIPATKSFLCQLLNLSLLSLLIAKQKGKVTDRGLQASLDELRALPDGIAAQLAGWRENAQRAADSLQGINSLLFLGRDVHFPIAREGALKIKESAYLHAEAYPAGELRHGPTALLEARTAVVVLATADEEDEASLLRRERIYALMSEIRNHGALIIAVSNVGDHRISRLADHVVPVNPAREQTLPILETVPLQLLAYTAAANRGIDVDAPRNLSKAVLLE